MQRRRFIKALGLGSMAGMVSASLYQCASGQKRPNIVFILVDDLGWRDLGCYGTAFYETPNIDRLAAAGMRFTDAYAACPVCSPTRASIMSGKYPARLGLTDWIPGRKHNRGREAANRLVSPDFKPYLDLKEQTVAEALKKQGYHTGFFGKWHLGGEPCWPEHQGFDVNKGGWTRGAPYYRQYDPGADCWYGDSGYFSPYRNPRLEDGPEGEYLTDRLTDETLAFIETHQHNSFLAFLSFYTVHNPLHGKENLVRKFRQKAKEMGLLSRPRFNRRPQWAESRPSGLWRERLLQTNAEYAAMIYSLDDNIGRLQQKLDDLGIADNTILFFMSDNGGLSTAEGSPTCNAPLRAGKGWLYEGGIREPMIVKWPAVVKPGSVCHEPVISTDFYPTILEMTRTPLLPRQHQDGLSLVPLLTGAPSLQRQCLYWHYPHYANQGGNPGSVIRCGRYKLIKDYEAGLLELYDLDTDMGEQHNLAAEKPELTRALHSRLQKWLKSIDARLPKTAE